MKLDDKFTLLIPTFNRYSYLLRLLKYYQSYNFPFPINVLDSSSHRIDNIELKELLKNKNIIHYKYQPNIFIAVKIAKGLSHISTPYSALCADDDYITPFGINECIHYLDQNKEYELAQGEYITHRLVTKRKTALFRWEPGCRYNSIEIKDPIERLQYHLSHYVGNTFYAVYRTKVLNLIWHEAAIFTKDWGLSEIFPSALCVLYSKTKKLPVFYASREWNNYQWYDDDYAMKMYSEDKMKLCIKGLSRHVQMIGNLNIHEADTIAKNSLESYTNPILERMAGKKNLIYKILKMAYNVFGLKIFFLFVKDKLLKKSFSSVHDFSDRYNHIHNFQTDLNRIKNSVLEANLKLQEQNRIRKTYMKILK